MDGQKRARPHRTSACPLHSAGKWILVNRIPTFDLKGLKLPFHKSMPMTFKTIIKRSEMLPLSSPQLCKRNSLLNVHFFYHVFPCIGWKGPNHYDVSSGHREIPRHLGLMDQSFPQGGASDL